MNHLFDAPVGDMDPQPLMRLVLLELVLKILHGKPVCGVQAVPLMQDYGTIIPEGGNRPVARAAGCFGGRA